MSEKYVYGQARKILFDRFPDMALITDEEDAYFVYADFVRFLIKKIDENPHDAFVTEAFDFLNEMVNEGDDGLCNLVQVQIFEALIESNELIKTSQKLLFGQALLDFEKIRKGESFT